MNKAMNLMSIAMLLILGVALAFAQGTGGQSDGANGGATDSGSGQTDDEAGGAGQGTGSGEQVNVETGTQNKGDDNKLQVQTQTQEQVGDGTGLGEQAKNQAKFMTQTGKEAELSDENGQKLKVGNSEAKSGLKLEAVQSGEKTMIQTQLSNGRNAEIKVMPDTASETALARLRLKNCVAEEGCSIELKEVGSGEQVKAAYEVKAQKQAKVLGLFQAKMQVQAQIDAENGEVIQEKRPWWSFLASEVEE